MSSANDAPLKQEKASPTPDALQHAHFEYLSGSMPLDGVGMKVQSMTQEEYAQIEKQLKRKLDIRLMATITFIYILNYLDRNNIAAAKIAGIETSLHLTSTQYSTAVSLLFAGYILMQVPSNVFLTQIRPSIYLPVCMAVWGTISTSTAAVQSAGSLYAVRFLLGLVEAAFYPGCLLMISSWYRRSELGFRCAVLYSGAQIGSAFSGLIAAGITDGLNGVYGLPAWRWIFIIEGSITVAVAVFGIFILPNFPANTKWLSEEERAVARWRLMQDAGQADDDESSWNIGFKLAFVDWRLYVFALMSFCIFVTTATQNFFPTVVGTLGYGRTETLLLTVPPYMVGAVCSILNNLSADRLRNSSFHIIWPQAIAIVGFIIGASTLQTGARYFAMFLMIVGGHSANTVTIAWVQKTMLRPRVKRAAAVAFVNACSNAAQIPTAYLYPNSDGPRYVLAMSVNSGFALGAIILAVVMRLILIRANGKLDESTGCEMQVATARTRQDQAAAISGEDRLARKAGFEYVT